MIELFPTHCISKTAAAPVKRKARDLEDLTGKWGSVNSLLQSLIFLWEGVGN